MQNWQTKMENVDVRFKHGKRNDGVRYTFAMVITPENKVAFATAMTNPRDNFSRKIGRNIAIGRAKKHAVNGNVHDPKTVMYLAQNMADESLTAWIKNEFESK